MKFSTTVWKCKSCNISFKMQERAVPYYCPICCKLLPPSVEDDLNVVKKHTTRVSYTDSGDLEIEAEI